MDPPMPLETNERTWRRLANRKSVYLIASLVLSGMMLVASPILIMLLLTANLQPLFQIGLIVPVVIIGGSFLLIRRTNRMMKVIQSSIAERGGVNRPSDPLLARLLRDPKLGFVLVIGGIISILAGLVVLSTMGFDGTRNQTELFLIFHLGGGSVMVLGVYILLTRKKKK